MMVPSCAQVQVDGTDGPLSNKDPIIAYMSLVTKITDM